MFITFEDLAGLALGGAIVGLPFVILGSVSSTFLVLSAVLFCTAIWA